jgi:choline monooxygenase
MWNHDGRLPHLLKPAQYSSPDQHERELSALFHPSWFCVGLTDDVPNHGDYFTWDAFGTPVLVRNEHGNVVAFLNVCAHRHGLLARDAKGSSPRIRCSYHGWEYDSEGKVCKIPEAECFKPVRKGEFVLRGFRARTLARLIFICMNDAAPDLEETLGPETCALIHEMFTPEMREIATWQVNYGCNWKVLVENTLEDYHVPLVHAKSLKTIPPKDHLSYAFGDNFVFYEDHTPDLDTSSMHWLARRLRSKPRFSFVQHVAYPALMLACTPLTSHLHILQPTSPTTCRVTARIFMAAGVEGHPHQRLLQWMLRGIARRSTWRVIQEDVDITAKVQQGLNASVFDGVIGAREARVHAFQHYVHEKCAINRTVRIPLPLS